jgi:hypothetical protein
MYLLFKQNKTNRNEKLQQPERPFDTQSRAVDRNEEEISKNSRSFRNGFSLAPPAPLEPTPFKVVAACRRLIASQR